MAYSASRTNHGRTGHRAGKKTNRKNLLVSSSIELLEIRRLMSVAIEKPTFRIRTHLNNSGVAVPLAATASPSGTTPSQILTAYGISSTTFGTVAGTGAGQTIAIVDAYNEPDLASDLATFDSTYSLTAINLTQVNETGGTTLPASDTKGGWGLETALDVEWSHVVAPKANIVVVEATTDNDSDLYAAVDEARNYSGVSAVSMSWGGDEASTDSSSNDSHFLTPSGHTGITFVAATGDNGAYSDTGTTTKVVGYPAISANVLAVGGTTLTLGTNGAYSSESGWGYGTSSNSEGGSGGGISKYTAQPSYQSGVVTQSTTFRTIPDISIDADPDSGVPVYDVYDNGSTTPWQQIGGTSLATPMWAGIIAITNQGRVASGLTSLNGLTQTLPAIYSAPTTDFHDITTGNNGYAAGTGYDLVTGRGTPIVNQLVPYLVATGTTTATPTIGSFSASPTSVTVGTATTLTASSVTESGGTISSVQFYRESNGTTGLQTSSDTLVGSGSASGSTYTISAPTTGLSAGTYTFYAVATDSSGNVSATSSTTLTVNAAAAGSPNIGAFTASPASVTIGTPSTLTATNVTETSGTISSVQFYRETNGTTGLQTGSDTLLGTGTQSGTTWTISAPTTGFSAGTYTYYAVATDSNAVSSSASSATLTVTAATSVTSDLRIVAYNIEDDINGATTPLPGLYAVLEGIGEEQVAGNVRPIDILGLEETTSNADVTPIATALNSYYGTADVYAQSTYQGTQSGTNADGNGPNAVVYNSTTVTLLASVGVGTPKGSSNGIYRQPVRYEFQPVGDTGTNGIFYVYVAHTKSGSTSADATDRGEEATVIRADEATLPANASVIYEGDLNSTPVEAEFTDFEATGQGEAYDPFGYPTAPTRTQKSDSSTSLSYRDDYQLQTANVYNDTGAINYVTNSFHNFGNNGSVTNPSSSSNTALNTDLVTDGGAFISASTIYTDLGTASDHLPVVADYTITTAAPTGTPTIGAFSASPSTVTTGTATTLTASSVVETGGTGSITGVSFYRESNGTTGLQIGLDTLLGAGTQSGTSWSISAATTGLSAGTYTYYAVASDSNGNSSVVSSTTLTVTAAAPGTPTIGSFVANPSSVTLGTSTTLTASNVTETGGTGSITGVNFYLESNSTTGLQINSDTLVGAGSQNGTTWTVSASTSSLSAGTYTYYAVATDSNGASSTVLSTTLTVTAAVAGTPSIGTFVASPSTVTVGTATMLTASNVVETGTGSITSVNFYRETNSTTGLQIGSDALIGSGTKSGTTWTISAPTTAFAAGTYTYYAVATDSNGNSSATLSTTLTVTAASRGTPTIGELTISPSDVSAAGTTALTASNVSETNGTISSVSFYRESNGTTGLQTGTGGDTLVGSGTQSGNTWTLSSVSTSGLTAGTYTYYAIATDSSATVSAAVSAVLTINGTSGTTTDLVGFDVSTQTSYGTSPLAPSTLDSSLTSVPGLTRGSGVTLTGTGAARGWGGTAWSETTAAAGVTASEFFSFGVTVGSGYTDTLSTFDWNYRRSSTGPANAELDYSINGGTYSSINSAISLASNSSSGAAIPEITLPTLLSNLVAGTNVTFRVTPYGATSTAGSCYVFDVAASTAADMYVNGVATAVSTYPTVAFSVTNYTANESDGTATITVNRTGVTTGISTIQYTTSDGSAVAGTDYNATSGSFTFAANDTSKTFTIPLTNIAATAGTRVVNLALFNASSGTQTGVLSVATLTVTDNIAPQFAFSASTYSVNENAGTATITVSRTANTTEAASVNYATSDGSAVAGTNYTATSGTLTYAANQTTATFTVTIANLLVSNAGSATVNLALSSPSVNAVLGSQATSVLTIALNAAPTLAFSASAYAANESDGSTTITVTRTGSLSSQVTVNYATSNGTAIAGTDYTAASGTLTFAANVSTQTFTVYLANLAAPAGTRVVNLTLSAPSTNALLGSQSTSAIDITDNLAPVFVFDAANFYANEEDGTATITVDRTGGVQAASVMYATSNGSAVAGTDYNSASGTLNFAANQTSATFTVQLIDVVTFNAGVATVNLTLSSPSTNAQLGSQSTAVLTIADNAAPKFPAWLDPTSVATWTASTKTLVVTGQATIIADPGTDEPIIQASGSAAVLTVSNSFTGTIHIGGLTLANGATAAVVSLGVPRSATNYRVLILGTPIETIAPTFSIAANSTLDLADNDMIVYDGTLSTIATQIKTAYNGGAYNGNGITSSKAASDSTYLTTLGVMPNTTDGTTTIYSTFDTATLNANAILVKYTYYGDSNLDGQVDGSDYTNIDNGFHNALTGWLNGDFNDDGVIDGSDYTLIDNAFNIQGNPLTSQAAAQIAKPASVFSVVIPPPSAYSAGLADDIVLDHKKSVAASIFA